MTHQMRRMLVHSIAGETCRARLHQARIWKGMYASLFLYHIHPNAMKALFSFCNWLTHSILIRTGEMRISLIDVAKIGGLLVWGEIYNEHIPPQSIVEEDALLKSSIDVYKFLVGSSRRQHNHKNYVSFTDWAEELALDIGSSRDS